MFTTTIYIIISQVTVSSFSIKPGRLSRIPQTTNQRHLLLDPESLSFPILNKSCKKFPQYMSFFDSSEYSSSDSDVELDDEEIDPTLETSSTSSRNNEDDEYPTIEESPVPMSKNSGNRFVAFIFDKALNVLSGKSIDPNEMHESRILDTEQHVFFCRKTNLYNETFNTQSIADIVWSHQL